MYGDVWFCLYIFPMFDRHLRGPLLLLLLLLLLLSGARKFVRKHR